MKNKKLKKIILIAIAAVLVIVMGVVAMKITISNNKISVLVAREEIGYNEEIKQSDESRFEIVQKNKDDIKQGYFDSFEALLTTSKSYGYITDSKILVGEVVYPSYFRMSGTAGSYYIPKVQYDGFTNPVVTPFDVSKAHFATNSIVKNQLAYITGNITEPVSGKIYYGLLIKKMLITNIVENTTEDGYSSLEVVVESDELDRINEIEKYGSNLKFVLANKTIVDQIDDTLEDVTKTYITNTGDNPIVKEYIPTSEKLIKMNSKEDDIWFFNDSKLDLRWRGKIDNIVVQHYDFETGDRGKGYGVYTLGKEISYDASSDEYYITKDMPYGFYVMDFYAYADSEDEKEPVLTKKKTYTFAYEGITESYYNFELENQRLFIFLNGNYDYLTNQAPSLAFKKSYFNKISYFKNNEYKSLKNISVTLETVEQSLDSKLKAVFTNIDDNATLDIYDNYLDYFSPKKANQEPVSIHQIRELEEYLKIGTKFTTSQNSETKYDARINELINGLKASRLTKNADDMEKVIGMIKRVFNYCFPDLNTSSIYNTETKDLDLFTMNNPVYKANDYRVYTFVFLQQVFGIKPEEYFKNSTQNQKTDIKTLKSMIAEYYKNTGATSASSVKLRIREQEFEIYFSIVTEE